MKNENKIEEENAINPSGGYSFPPAVISRERAVGNPQEGMVQGAASGTLLRGSRNLEKFQLSCLHSELTSQR